jgi:hypothetical protein
MCLPQFIFKELDLEITDFENYTRPFASIKHSPKKNIKKVIKKVGRCVICYFGSVTKVKLSAQ